ncbi:hypothetical protein D3C73_1077730 [compost metagenome]
MLLEAHGEVATTIKGLRVQAAEVANARKRDVDQAIHEFIHTGAAEGNLRADRHLFANLEACNRVAGARDNRLLASDRSKVGCSNSRLLGVGSCLAHAHVDDNLVHLRDHHLVRERELLLKCCADAGGVFDLEPRLVICLSHR